eukprot:5235490-Amphidinium_carterae.1
MPLDKWSRSVFHKHSCCNGTTSELRLAFGGVWEVRGSQEAKNARAWVGDQTTGGAWCIRGWCPVICRLCFEPCNQHRCPGSGHWWLLVAFMLWGCAGELEPPPVQVMRALDILEAHHFTCSGSKVRDTSPHDRTNSPHR